MTHLRIVATTAALCVSVTVGGSAGGQSVAGFYTGKTITISAATGAGATYGVHGRLLAETMKKYIPGNPNIIMQFKPGGGGARMANYMYNVAPRDGTHIGFPLKYIAVNQALGRKGLKYDAAKFGYLGSLGPINSVVAILKDKSPVASVEDAKMTQAIMASTGKSSETFITPTLMNNLLGTKFKVVTGYRGMKGVELAMAKGEAHGRASAWDSLKAGQPEWLAQNKVALIALSGLARNWDLPNVPTLIELAAKPENKEVLRFFGNGNAVGWLFMTPPDVPADRFAALRMAFEKSMKDPAYQAAVAARRLGLNPVPGAKITSLINDTLAVTPAQLASIRAAMGMK